MSFFTLAFILLWVLVAFESLLLVLVLRELGVLYLGRREAFERDGPDIGKPLPTLDAMATDGSPRTLSDLQAEFSVLLFGAVGCRLCGPAMEKFVRWADRIAGLSPVMLMERGDRSTPNRLETARWPIWFLSEGEMFRGFGVRVSPYAVLVDSSGIVLAKGLVKPPR